MRRSTILAVLILYWLAAMTSTHWPKAVAPQLMVLGTDKIVHFFIYAILAALLFVAWPAKWSGNARAGWSQTGRFLGVWLVAAAYGVIDELTQPWFGRQCDIWDWLADVSGALVALLVCAWLARRSKSRKAIPSSQGSPELGQDTP